MQPIEQLLHRIQWDDEFGRGAFALGYYDREVRQEITLPFTSVRFEPDRRGFSVTDEGGRVIHVPLHRVRTVYKDGVAIWHRPARVS